MNGFAFELKGAPEKKTPDLVTGLEGGGHDGGHQKIRCPRCAWQPRKTDLWACRCGHSWNTFETRGRCPACDYQWKNTMCFRCQQWSPHEDWYEKQPSGSGPS